MTEQQEPPVKRRRRTLAPPGLPPSWPGDPEQAEPAAVDFEAIAHILANTCRWGGRTRRFHSLAQHALIASEEIEALDGIDDRDRRVMALHALLACARAAWLGDEEAGHPASDKAAARNRAHGKHIDRAVREAAGLTPEPPEEWAELLRFVARMADAAERRDLGVGAGGFPLPAAAPDGPAHGPRAGGRALAGPVPGVGRKLPRRRWRGHRPAPGWREGP